MAETIFSKIIDGSIPADIVYRDEKCLAFRDIAPKAPVHILVIPIPAPATEPPAMLSVTSDSDIPLLGHLLRVAAKVAEKEGYQHAFNVLINNGKAAGQTVDHLHIHVLAGRSTQLGITE